MKKRPVVGAMVRLNDFGIKRIRGLDTWEMVEQAKKMRIETVSQNSLVPGHCVYPIEVDQPLINRFLIDSMCVEEIVYTSGAAFDQKPEVFGIKAYPHYKT